MAYKTKHNMKDERKRGIGAACFFMKHPRFWGSFCIAIAMIGSNAGSAWAGGAYQFLNTAPPWQNSAPASVGFQLLMYTVYPLAVALLVLGVYLWSRDSRS